MIFGAISLRVSLEDGIASAQIEELSAALPGFAEAMAWPG